MASRVVSINVLPGDILCHIFEQLVGDKATLVNISLTSKAWNSLSVPNLLRQVDLASSYNHDQMVPYLDTTKQHDMNRSTILLKQRAFLHLMTEKPGLARHVHTLSWTLIWQDGDDGAPTELDRQTWEVFSRLNHVTTLDLAQHIGRDPCTEPLVRRTPAKLFPRAISARLGGYMHRRWAAAIMSSIDPSKLRVLQLDALKEEGMLPDGKPMTIGIARRYARTSRNSRIEDLVPFKDEMIQRQEQRTACSFPGPMWYPLRFLAGCSLQSLSTFDAQICPYNTTDNMRNYVTTFQAVADVLRTAKGSLQSVRIAFGEDPRHYGENGFRCGNGLRWWHRHQHKCVAMGSIFLLYVLPALCEEQFPRLAKLEFQGFRIITDIGGDDDNLHREEKIAEYQWKLPLTGVSIMEEACVDYRSQSEGTVYHPDPESLKRYTDVFQSS